MFQTPEGEEEEGERGDNTKVGWAFEVWAGGRADIGERRSARRKEKKSFLVSPVVLDLHLIPPNSFSWFLLVYLFVFFCYRKTARLLREHPKVGRR